jgi:hypothetical protein
MFMDEASSNRRRLALLAGGLLLAALLWQAGAVLALAGSGLAQIPTVAIPTVTGTLPGTQATVTMDQDQINVRLGPGMNYPEVGVLIAGQTVPALARTVGGLWVQISYPGAPGGVAWVYAPLVKLDGSLPVVAPPPTPTPRVTPTIDPTLAAQFLVDAPEQRLPTYTPPPPLAIPTFLPAESASGSTPIPMGLLIVILSVIGAMGLLISLLSRR